MDKHLPGDQTDHLMEVGCSQIIEQARYHQENHEYELAERAYRRAIDMRCPGAVYTLGQLLTVLQRIDEAEELYQQFIQQGMTELLITYGNLLADNPDRWDEAEVIYRLAAQQGDELAHANLGNLLSDMGRLREAEEEYRRGIASGDVISIRNLGILCREEDRLAEAEHYLLEAIEGGDVGAMTPLGGLYRDVGEIDDATMMYMRAIDAGDANALIDYATLLDEDLMNPADAERLYRDAIKRQIGGGLAELNLGTLLADRGEEQEARKMYERAIEQGEADAHLGLADLFAAHDRFREADEEYALAVESNVRMAHARYGRFLMRLHRHDDAEPHLRLAAEAGDGLSVLALNYLLGRRAVGGSTINGSK